MPLDYDLRLLGYVVAIRDEGSVSGAARRLRVSQPTLSRQLRDLEARLNVTLFHRAARGLAPTAAGDALCSSAARLLKAADDILDDVRLADQGLAGPISIAFAGSGINGPLGKALARVRRHLPGVELRLVETFDHAEMSEGVLSGRFDLAIQRMPVRDARLRTQVWTREPLTLFLPSRHPLSTRNFDPAEISVLAQTPLVMWPRDASPRAYDEVMTLCQRAHVVPRIAAEARTVQTMLALVAAGFGASVMADSYRVLRREGVTCRPLIGTATTLYLVSRNGDTNPILTRLWKILDGSPSSGSAR